MIFAAPGDTGYNIMLMLHLLTVIVAFAPAFVHPMLARQAQAAGDNLGGRILSAMAGNGRRIYAPALILTGVLGFGLVGMSDDVYSLSDGWVIAAILVWIAQNGILHALILPGERAWADGDAEAESKVSMGGAAITLLLVVQIYLMVFQP